MRFADDQNIAPGQRRTCATFAIPLQDGICPLSAYIAPHFSLSQLAAISLGNETKDEVPVLTSSEDAVLFKEQVACGVADDAVDERCFAH